jgi:hypothetical protein
MRKGDRIVTINSRPLKGVTHRKALEIMKSPRPEIVLVVARQEENTLAVTGSDEQHESNVEGQLIRPEVMSQCSNDSIAGSAAMDNYRIYKANLIKDGAALGFILEGGKDSPLGDCPLAIKRIFKGNLRSQMIRRASF